MSESTTEKKSEPTGEERDKALKESYQSALKALRTRHLAEFNTLRVEEARKRGITWTPPKTDEEKAAEQMAALLREHPALAEQFSKPAAAAPSVPDTHIEEPDHAAHPAAEQDAAQRI